MWMCSVRAADTHALNYWQEAYEAETMEALAEFGD